MKFLERFFSRKKKTDTTTNTNNKGTQRTPMVNNYSGSIFGIIQNDDWYTSSTLVEVKSPSDVLGLPSNLINGEDSYGWADDSDATSVNDKMKFWRGMEGGRSFRRPQWSTDLDSCGAFIFPIHNNAHIPDFSWRIKHWAIVDAPILFVIIDVEQKQPEVAPGAEAPKAPEIFTKCPTEKELFEKMRMAPDAIGHHPVKIVFARFETPDVPEPAPAVPTDAKGKGKASVEATEVPAPPPPPPPKMPSEFLEGLKWLSEHLVVDSYSQKASLASELKAEEERKKKLEAEQKKVKESAPIVPKSAQPPTEPAALAA